MTESPLVPLYEIVSGPMPEFKPKRTLYLPVDGSMAAHEAVEWTVKTVAQPEDLLLLVNVRPVLGTCKE